MCSQLKINCFFGVDFISIILVVVQPEKVCLFVAVRVNEITLIIVLKFFALKCVGLEFLRGL